MTVTFVLLCVTMGITQLRTLYATMVRGIQRSSVHCPRRRAQFRRHPASMLYILPTGSVESQDKAVEYSQWLTRRVATIVSTRASTHYGREKSNVLKIAHGYQALGTLRARRTHQHRRLPLTRQQLSNPRRKTHSRDHQVRMAPRVYLPRRKAHKRLHLQH